MRVTPLRPHLRTVAAPLGDRYVTRSVIPPWRMTIHEWESRHRDACPGMGRRHDHVRFTLQTGGMPPRTPIARRRHPSGGTDRSERGIDHPSLGGPEGNARLTGMTAAVLLVLLAAEGLTILQVHSLITPHVVIGMVLVPFVAAAPHQFVTQVITTQLQRTANPTTLSARVSALPVPRTRRT